MQKYGRREFPAGLDHDTFKYVGRPAKEQGDFGGDVGIVDMACVNQFGEANNAKFYHAGVVQHGGRWFLYCEWGRCKPGKSWESGYWTGNAQDFQFTEGTEAEVRREFAKKCKSKNTGRLVQKDVGGVTVWAAKPGKDGYIVQQLATREKGLPDALSIKDDEGVSKPAAKKATTTKKTRSKAPSKRYQPQVVSLANALVGGTQSFARAAAQATGVTPTMAAIEQVRNAFIPAALQRLKVVGDDVKAQVRDTDLRDISKQVSAMVPRPTPRTGVTDEEAILNQGNILLLQQNLDAYESALQSEDFGVVEESTQADPGQLLNAEIEWVDPKSELGKWVAATYQGMTRNRHYDFSGAAKIYNIFKVSRPDRDTKFTASVAKVGGLRRGRFRGERPELQPSRRIDLTPAEGDSFGQAQVMLGIHGTRAVNVAPILQTNLRLPKSLRGVHITGAAFGHGIYFADDWKKSWGYTGGSSRWGNAGGNVQGRRKFMFLCDMILGDPYMAPSAWSISDRIPDPNKDCVYAHHRHTSVANNEYVIFDATYQQIRYIIEMDQR